MIPTSSNGDMPFLSKRQMLTGSGKSRQSSNPAKEIVSPIRNIMSHESTSLNTKIEDDKKHKRNSFWKGKMKLYFLMKNKKQNFTSDSMVEVAGSSSTPVLNTQDYYSIDLTSKLENLRFQRTVHTRSARQYIATMESVEEEFLDEENPTRSNTSLKVILSAPSTLSGCQ